MTHPLSGNLSLVPLAELLETVRREAETGVLSFVTAVAPATIWVREGEAVDAAMGPRDGMQVFEVLALLEEATFSFVPSPVPVNRRLSLTPAQLVAHCRRYVLETSRWVATLPALTETVTVPERGVTATNADEQAVLRALRPGMTYLSLLLETPINPGAILEFLCRWGRPQPVPSSIPPSGTPSSRGRAPTLTGVEAALRKHRTPPPKALPDSPWVPQAPSLPAGFTRGTPAAGSGSVKSTLLAFPAIQGAPDAAVHRSTPASGLAGVAPTSQRAPQSERMPSSGMSSAPYTPGTTVFLPVTRDELSSATSSSAPPSGGPLTTVDLKGTPLLATGDRFSVHLATASSLGVSEARGSHGLVALKTAHVGNPEARAALENEAQHLAHYTHRNLVALARYDAEAEAPVLVTHYVYGVNLSELLEAHRVLPPSIALGIVTQVLRALEFLHDPDRAFGGVAHCSVSPRNILLDVEGTVRLVGFSSARALRGGQADGNAVCEAGYASPELLANQPVDALTDLYSVGVLLGRCLGLRSRQSAATESVEALSIEALALRAQAPAPSDRPASASEMLAELKRLSAIGGNEQALAAWVRFSTHPGPRVALRVQSGRPRRERPSRTATLLRVSVGLGALLFAGWSVYSALMH
jgi:serine/threonine protein kinase